ncbi:MAG: hypothetical protein ACLP5H_31120 [Desulfomonilaceae bacterium]
MSGKKKSPGKSPKKQPKPKKGKQSQKTWLRVAPKPTHRDVEFMETPPLSEIQPPPGFRVVSYTQAMMEYASPVLETSESEDIKELNEKMQIAMTLWNYNIAGDLVAGPRPSEKEVIHNVGKFLKLTAQEATEFFNKMIQRKSFLFPEELQQKGVPFMVMRKEISHLITRFDESELNLSDEPILPDKEDKKFVKDIKKLDSFILRRADYDEYEDLFTSVRECCTEVFEKWLIAKGVKESRENLVWFPEILCNFIYGYLHEDAFVLKSIPPGYLAVFFCDFVLRKVVIEPHLYTYIPASIKLFYKFLCEKNYLDNAMPVIAVIDEIEPHFIDTLKERFG